MVLTIAILILVACVGLCLQQARQEWARGPRPRPDWNRLDWRMRVMEREIGLVRDPDGGWFMQGYGPYDRRGQIVRFEARSALVVSYSPLRGRD
jgi:hypothetical protein